MKSKNLLLSLFLLSAAVQLYVPAQMILSKEDVLKTGKEFRFKTRPIDPNDPFRGKYITLFFEENSFLLDRTAEWKNPSEFYVVVVEDAFGFAQIAYVTEEEPAGTQDYFLASTSSSISNEQGTTLFIDFPFSKYFMEESKAQEAEVAVWESHSDSTQSTYAVVAVKEGDSALKNVFINGTPINKVVQERMKQ